jgi:hypothetical protein
VSEALRHQTRAPNAGSQRLWPVRPRTPGRLRMSAHRGATPPAVTAMSATSPPRLVAGNRRAYPLVMAGVREGGCSCGEVRYRLASEPLFVHCCHCLNCQRQTGSAFVVNLLIESDRVELLAAEPRAVEVPRDDGSTQQIFRCSSCAVAVFSHYGSPRISFVRGGTLDDPTGVTPDVHIYTRSKVGWVTLPAGVPSFEEYYETKALWPAASLERLAALRSPGSPSARSR